MLILYCRTGGALRICAAILQSTADLKVVMMANSPVPISLVLTTVSPIRNRSERLSELSPPMPWWSCGVSLFPDVRQARLEKHLSSSAFLICRSDSSKRCQQERGCPTPVGTRMTPASGIARRFDRRIGACCSVMSGMRGSLPTLRPPAPPPPPPLLPLPTRPGLWPDRFLNREALQMHVTVARHSDHIG
jgi:hypothetical protein